MRSLPFVAAGAVALASLTVVGVTTSAAHAAPADTAYALNGSSLLSFATADPSDVSATGITGVTAGETLVGLDVRPQNGQLYALGVNAAADTATLYVVHEQTGYAAAVGTTGSVAFTIDGTTVVDLPDPATTGYGFDVNPAVDRVRVTAGALNFRVNPNTGAPVDGSLATGTNPDGSTNSATTTVDGSAYTNNLPTAGGISTLYTLDAVSNSLFIQNPANSGTQNFVASVELGGNPLDFTSQGGFDIPTGVDATASGAGVTSGAGYAALTVGGTTKLYRINLVTGAATAVGPIGNGLLPIQGLALQRDVDEGYPVIGLSEAGTQLSRFSSTSPGTTSNVSVAGITAGETLVAVAWRPQTGQLLGFGVNPTADTGTLYVVDPQSGGVSVVGVASTVAWAGTDLPNPTVIGYGMDVNPAADRVRITAGSGLNGRINPVTGVPVGLVPDTATSQPITAVSYTNAFGRDLTSSQPTTLYGVDPDADQLVVLNPPNNGVATLPIAVTLGGSPLDFGAFVGLDIPEGVTVATSNAAATGSAYAALTVGGTPAFFKVDLATGQATSLGTLVGSGALRSLAIGQAGANRPAPPPPVAVPATLTKAGAAKQQKKTVDSGRVLTCPAGFKTATCSTELKITATYKTKAKGRTKVHSAVVGAATVKTVKGKSTRLKVTLSPKGVKLLKRQGRLSAKVAITAPTGPKAANRTTTVKVTLLKKRL